MTSKKPSGVPTPRKPRAAEFRNAIAQAEQEGVSKDQMVLRLTLSDTADLKRDRNIPLEDISFAGGAMRFMGVKIEPGGVAVSVLQRDSGEGAASQSLSA
ncbi:MAG: hypothetical protein ACHP7N_17220 [Caulobacterales bacterium]